MSKQAALAVGGLTERGNDGGSCIAYAVADGGRVVISEKYGAVIIQAPSGAHTPEGIGVGSTFSQVLAAYPDATEYQDGYLDGAYLFDVQEGQGTSSGDLDTATVGMLKVHGQKSDCAGALG
ncbi:hypothetical protein [Actinophytocola sediminis]